MYISIHDIRHSLCLQEAMAAIEGANGFGSLLAAASRSPLPTRARRFELLGSTITVDWAFSQGPSLRRTTTRRRE